MTPDPHDAAIARYIDAKADVARRHADRKPHEAEMHRYTARVLDALADEVRMGLAGDPSEAPADDGSPDRTGGTDGTDNA